MRSYARYHYRAAFISKTYFQSEETNSKLDIKKTTAFQRKSHRNADVYVFSITSNSVMSETDPMSHENTKDVVNNNIAFSSVSYPEHSHILMERNKDVRDDGVGNFSISERQSLDERLDRTNEEEQTVQTDIARDLVLDLVETILVGQEEDHQEEKSLGKQDVLCAGLNSNNFDCIQENQFSVPQNHMKTTLSEIADRRCSSGSNLASETSSQVHFETPILNSMIGKEEVPLEDDMFQLSEAMEKGTVLNELDRDTNHELQRDSSLLFIPREWETQFFTPAKTQINHVHRNSEETKGGPETLLDFVGECLSPLSTAKYSERDLENIKKTLTKQESLKVQNLQLELERVRENLDNELSKGSKMQIVLNDYELTMANMIEDARKLKEEHQSQYISLLMEKKQIDSNFVRMELSFKDLDRRYQDLKIAHERCRRDEDRLNNIAKTTEENSLGVDKSMGGSKIYIESKLNSGLVSDVSKLQENYQRDISTIQTKLNRAELRIKSLETLIEVKGRENRELMAICDDLIKKLDHVG